MEEYIYCKKCRKPLKDKISRKLGYGPTCYKQLNPKNKKVIK